MSPFLEANRIFSVTTPLGEDALLLSRFSCREAISEPFELRLELTAAAGTDVPFDALLGSGVTLGMTLAGDARPKRHLHGIVRSVTRGETTSAQGGSLWRTAYRLTVVPRLWLLTRAARSRIFQQKSVPEILKAALDGIETAFELQGQYEARDYCVQYRETDFDFVSRLMEEEGIYYYFRHGAAGHTMVVADTPMAHDPVPGAEQIRFDAMAGGALGEDRIQSWERTQELTTGKYTLRDHSFELPGSSLEAIAPVDESVEAGKVVHKLRVGRNDQLEVYDYPGGYAGRFDGVAPGGGDRAGDLQKIFQDNKRTVGIRMDQAAVGAVVGLGASNCRQLAAGHKFTLEDHDDADGSWVLLSVEHEAETAQGSGAPFGAEFRYANRFTCIPAARPYRTPRRTARPRVDGCQTAVVVGPSGEEIFTDKYGRVKVQFHWDREGKRNGDSSCWVRVASTWAGTAWGAVHVPRIGQEVVVDFLEGDPDQPIVTGSVYNAMQMPPYALPANRTQSGIKSRSTPQGGPGNFNELRFEDRKGQEHVFLQAEKDLFVNVKNNEGVTVGHDRSESVGHDERISIGNDRTEDVAKNETLTVGEDQSLSVGKNQAVAVGTSRTLSVGKDQSTDVGANRSTSVSSSDSLNVGQDRSASIGRDDSLTVGKRLRIDAGDEIVLTAGSASITLKKNGTILISGKDVSIQGSGKVNVKAASDVVVKGAKVVAN